MRHFTIIAALAGLAAGCATTKTTTAATSPVATERAVVAVNPATTSQPASIADDDKVKPWEESQENPDNTTGGNPSTVNSWARAAAVQSVGVQVERAAEAEKAAHDCANKAERLALECAEGLHKSVREGHIQVASEYASLAKAMARVAASAYQMVGLMRWTKDVRVDSAYAHIHEAAMRAAAFADMAQSAAESAEQLCR